MLIFRAVADWECYLKGYLNLISSKKRRIGSKALPFCQLGSPRGAGQKPHHYRIYTLFVDDVLPDVIWLSRLTWSKKFSFCSSSLSSQICATPVNSIFSINMEKHCIFGTFKTIHGSFRNPTNDFGSLVASETLRAVCHPKSVSKTHEFFFLQTPKDSPWKSKDHKKPNRLSPKTILPFKHKKHDHPKLGTITYKPIYAISL